MNSGHLLWCTMASGWRVIIDKLCERCFAAQAVKGPHSQYAVLWDKVIVPSRVKASVALSWPCHGCSFQRLSKGCTGCIMQEHQQSSAQGRA